MRSSAITSRRSTRAWPRDARARGRRRSSSASSVSFLEFKERATPTIIRSADADLPATGRFWIDPVSGRVLKSELTVADRSWTGRITVTYEAVPKLTVWAPILMTEEYTGPETIFGRATYPNFRQFSVSVGTIIK